jgi:AcrR family transcriptional regulator
MQTRSIETKGKILRAAQNLISQAGYESASVSDICQSAGISKGAFYHHFPSKQSVFMELLTEWLKGIDVGLETLRSSRTDASQSLIRMADIMPEIIRAAEGRFTIFLEFWSHAARDPELWKTAVAPFSRYREYLKQIVAQMDPSAEMDESRRDAAALAVMSLAIGLLLQGIMEPRAADWAGVGKESLQMLIQGMTRRSS